jgi:hypothetical protein
VGWLLAAPEGWIVGVIGLPGTTALAWRIAPRVIDATRRGAVARALGLAVGSVMITDALVSIVMAAAETLGGISTLSADGRELTLPAIATAGLTALALAIFLFLVGAVFVGLVVLASVVPLAFIWAGLVRLLAGRGWAR